MLLDDFAAATDKRTFVETLNAFEMTQLIKALRNAPYASTEAKVATLEPVALAVGCAFGLRASDDRYENARRTAGSGIRLGALDVRVREGAAHAR